MTNSISVRHQSFHQLKELYISYTVDFLNFSNVILINNRVMNSIEEKLIGIAKILALRDFSSLSRLEDLTNDEIDLLHSRMNLRFSHSPSGYMCFYSSKVGKAGIAQNRIQALVFMLDTFEFKPDLNKDIIEQLQSHLDSIP